MKRFTETTKWADPWFRKLHPTAKLLWLYLCDNCDHAGVIELDPEVAAMQMGVRPRDIDPSKLGDRIISLPGGKLWVQKFVDFQYGKISRDCKAHGPVFASIAKHELERVSKGLAKGPMGGIHTPQDTDTDKDKDKDQDTDTAKPNLERWLERAKPADDWEREWWTAKFNLEDSAGWEMRNGRKIKNWQSRQDYFATYFRSDKAEHDAANATVDPALVEAQNKAADERQKAKEAELVAELQADLARGRE
jgi:hypothetical protein